jgi:hypothetical protein
MPDSHNAGQSGAVALDGVSAEIRRRAGRTMERFKEI